MPRKNKNAYSRHNLVHIVRGGADYFSRIEDIAARAKVSLHMQVYIFDEDDTGRLVADALKKAAQRNVAVYLLVDGYASKGLSDSFIADLKAAGIHFGFFQPFLKSDSFYIGRRLHHKIMVADGEICMVAGINVGNRYNDIGATPAWLDWAICVEGEAAHQIRLVCERVWNRSPFREKCKISVKQDNTIPDICEVRVRRNDWVYNKTEITKTYRQAIQHAQSEVTMMTSYFWPPHKLLVRMAAASRRGVKIKLVLTAKADVFLSKYTERYLYQWLFRNNIEIYEYQKNILHGKITVCDRQWLTGGSYNLNNISAYASVELNLDVNDAGIAKEVSDELQAIIDKDCVRIIPADFSANNNVIQKFFFYLSYRIVHIIFYLFTFYFRQKGSRRQKAT